SGDLAHRVERDDDVGALAEVVDRALAGDPEHPGAQRPFRVVALVYAPHLVEHPLQDVLHVGRGNVAPQVGHDQRAESAIAVLEGLRLPVGQPGADLGERSLHIDLFVGHRGSGSTASSPAAGETAGTIRPRTSPRPIGPCGPGAVAVTVTSSPSCRNARGAPPTSIGAVPFSVSSSRQPRWDASGPLTVPEANRSPHRSAAPLLVRWASIWAGVQYIASN